MADRLFIGIDSGTQGTKAIVFSERQGTVLASSYRSYGLEENDHGGREQDPQLWIDACREILREVLSQPGVAPGQVAGIGVSGQQHGMVVLDRDGRVIRPAKLWCDTETVPQCRTITRALGGESQVFEAIGNQLAAGFTASKLLWLREREPENYGRLDSVLLPHDYINFWLTGERCTEYGDGSGTAYFDVRRRQWSRELLRAIAPDGRLEACLPALRQSHEAAGQIRRGIAKEFGLPPTVVVSSGGGDNMMAAIGTGNVRPGVVTASLGTSGTIYGYSDFPVTDASGELAAFCSSSGGWLPLVCTMNVTVATELVRNLLGIGLERMNGLAAESTIGSGGLLLLPYFNGERTPALPQATATLHGMTGRNMIPAHLYRAAMEGATFGLRYGLDVLRRNGIEPSEIRLVGGGSKSPLWRSMVAEIFGVEVVCPASAEAGCLGAALQALWCVECDSTSAEKAGDVLREICDRYVRLDEDTRIAPDRKRIRAYKEIYANFRTLNEALLPLNR